MRIASTAGALCPSNVVYTLPRLEYFWVYWLKRSISIVVKRYACIHVVHSQLLTPLQEDHMQMQKSTKLLERLQRCLFKKNFRYQIKL